LPDFLTGGAGNDTLTGGANTDTLDGGIGNDLMFGGNGTGLVDASDDLLYGGDGFDQLYGEDGNDTMNGGADSDTLYAGVGNDMLRGDSGNDYIFGEQGDDTLNGGANDDTLNGQSGSDTYIFQMNGGIDRIVEGTGASNDIDDLTGSKDANTATLRHTDGTSITFSIDGTASAIESFVFSGDGSTYNLSQLAVLFNAPPTGQVTISGQAAQGQTLTAGHNLSDADGVGTISFNWLKDGTATGIVGSTYLLGQADVGSRITAVARYTDGNGVQESVASSATSPVLNVNDTPTGGVSIAGIVAQGQVLTASNTLADADGIGPIGYQWLRNGLATGATGNGYTLTQVDVGAKISVLANYTDGQGTNEVIASAQTATVANVNDVPTGSVTITGTTTQGQVLNASNSLADVDGLGVVSYQWLRNGAATGITGNAYSLSQSDVGTKISVQASYTDGQGTNETLASTQTLAVANINDAPTGTVSISGAAKQGQVLTAGNTLADVDGLGGITYKWLRDSAVTGITGSTYTLGQADLGAKISVTATYTDGQGTLESVTSAQSNPVVSSNQSLTGTAANDTLTGGAGDDTLQGLAGNDSLTGAGGNDSLDGGAGSDAMTGGQGDDTYVLDASTDAITENAGEGTDLVQSSITYTLGNFLENLTLTGTAANSATGNSLDNVLTGNSAANKLTAGTGNDTLIGGAGTDTMVGGTGNDVYVVDVSTDVITENASEGTDTVQTAITFSIASLVNVENIALTGTAAVNATGNTLANVLIGNSAANTLTGGTGADTMVGGAGDDIYVVDNASDLTTENANEGNDLVQSSVTYSLSPNVERLTLTGTSAINGTGNGDANTLTGNSAVNTLTGGAGNDTLDGGAGGDSLVGGIGDDTYVVDNVADKTVENLGEGTDLVQSSITWTLIANMENLTLTGTSAINGTGNSADNILLGNSAVNTLSGGVGNDLLNGGAGGDSMVGGAGNDTYVVDNTADKTVENASEGNDLVQSSIAWTLGPNLEDLTLTGTAAINGTGNTLANALTGNSAANTLTGGGGNDTYHGGAGNDSLSASSTTSNDTYIWGRGEGVDTLTDAGGTDSLQILAGVSADQVWLRRVSNNLEVSVIGSGDSFTITNWYTAAANQVETIKLAGGKSLTAGNVQNLVSAMATFTPPSAGQTTLPANYSAALSNVIASNWT